jgi:hypothetical protein
MFSRLERDVVRLKVVGAFAALGWRSQNVQYHGVMCANVVNILVNMCYTWRHRGRAGGNGLWGDSIRNLFAENSRGDKKLAFYGLLNARVFNTHHGVTEHLTTHHGGRRGVLLRSVFVVGYLVLGLASGLEAFSREPPCDSIGALAVRQTPETSSRVGIEEALHFCYSNMCLHFFSW